MLSAGHVVARALFSTQYNGRHANFCNVYLRGKSLVWWCFLHHAYSSYSRVQPRRLGNEPLVGSLLMFCQMMFCAHCSQIGVYQEEHDGLRARLPSAPLSASGGVPPAM